MIESTIQKLARKNTLRSFLRNDRGAAALTFLMATAFLVCVCFGALDIARYVSIQSRLQTSLDNAALATGRLASLKGMDTPAKLQALTDEANAFFHDNFPSSYFGGDIDQRDIVTVTPNGSKRLILTINGKMPLFITGFFNKTALDLAARSVVSLDSGGIPAHVVFALDKGEPLASGNSGNKTNEQLLKLLESTPKALLKTLSVAQETPEASVNVAFVPFSDTVNVKDYGKKWVANWKNAWSANPEKNALAQSSAYDVDTHWTGCIAEPKPWQPIEFKVNSSGNFQPVFFSIETFLSHVKENGNPFFNYIQLQDASGKELSSGYSDGQSIPLKTTDPLNTTDKKYNRNLWAYFDANAAKQGNKTIKAIKVVSALEPYNCYSGNRVRYFNNDSLSINATIDSIASESLTGYSVPALGLLWSWRILHPEWAKNWQASAATQNPAVSNASDASLLPTKIIVLFTSGDNATWDNLNTMPGKQYQKRSSLWAMPEGKNKDHECTAAYDWNCIGFSFDYKLDGQSVNRNHTQNKFLPDTKPGNWPDSKDKFWSYPATSLIMAEPFTQDSSITSTSAWGSLTDKTLQLCRDIKSDDIKIYVVALKSGNLLSNDFRNACTSDGVIYTPDNLPDLASHINQAQTTGSGLRLVE